MELAEINAKKALPSAVLDFIFKDRANGIGSPEFEKALKKGDSKNIEDGIDSIILNAETKAKIKLTDYDRSLIRMIAHDEIAHRYNKDNKNYCN